MLRLNFSNLETGIEDVKVYYEIRKLTGHKCGFFGNSETSYTENKISDLTDDLSEISKILYEVSNSNTLRVSCKSIDFSIDFRDAVDINEKINKCDKKCNVIKIYSTQNDKVLYFYNCLFTEMLDEFHSRFFKYKFYFDFFDIK